jgi:hypothetical protein
MSDRFEFEQQIMNCWHVVDDIVTIKDTLESCEMKATEKDYLMNMLTGVETITGARFDKLFSIFESLVKQNKL